MNVKYSKQGDYYIPNIVAPENAKGFILSKYMDCQPFFRQFL